MEYTGIYIHIPFCRQKCPYCDFFSVPCVNTGFDAYTKALIQRIAEWGTKSSIKANTVYFGGGTPSLIPSHMLIEIISAIKHCFLLAEGSEITLEMNPAEHTEVDLKSLYRNGFNRLSIGLQSADSNELAVLQRKHSVSDAQNLILEAKSAGFSNISLDLIIGIPGQTKQSLSKSIEFCREYSVSHVSAYLLKIEPNTPFYLKQHELPFKNDDELADLYLFASNMLEASKFHQYEISNFCLPGAESLHNLKYWSCDDYLGLGPSSHSFINGKRFFYPNSFQAFYDNQIILEDSDPQTEYVMMQLRLRNGLTNNGFQKKFNKPIPDIYFQRAGPYEKLGFLIIDKNSIRLTKTGFLVSNIIIGDLLTSS